jgi:hypothetical protein
MSVTVRLIIEIEGKILNARTTSQMEFFKWSDFASSENLTELPKTLLCLMKKYDNVEMVTITITDGACTMTQYSNRYVVSYDQIRVMKWKESQRFYEDIEIYTGEKMLQTFKKNLKSDLIEFIRRFEVVHVNELHKLIKGDGLFWYELIYRSPGPSCQPEGNIKTNYDKGKHGIVAYKEPLSPEQIEKFELREWKE